MKHSFQVNSLIAGSLTHSSVSQTPSFKAKTRKQGLSVGGSVYASVEWGQRLFFLIECVKGYRLNYLSPIHDSSKGSQTQFRELLP